eukprot:3578685-Pyramimonas_sp.AAC.1
MNHSPLIDSWTFPSLKKERRKQLSAENSFGCRVQIEVLIAGVNVSADAEAHQEPTLTFYRQWAHSCAMGPERPAH